VLGSVDSESLDSEPDEVVDEVSNLSSDVILSAVQIVQTDEVTVANFIRILMTKLKTTLKILAC
jgi:hypothetical protein